MKIRRLQTDYSYFPFDLVRECETHISENGRVMQRRRGAKFFIHFLCALAPLRDNKFFIDYGYRSLKTGRISATTHISENGSVTQRRKVLYSFPLRLSAFA